MIGEYPVLTIITTVLNLIVVFHICTAVFTRINGALSSKAVRWSLWLFAFSTLILVAYRIERIVFGDENMALLPYWFLRDVALFALSLSLYRYERIQRKLSGWSI